MSTVRLRYVDLPVTICIAALLLSACGGSKSGNGTGTSPDDSTGGTGGGSASGGASSSTGGAPAGSVPCGTKNCLPPEGTTLTACCQDQFDGICGVVSRTGCVNAPKPPPPECPKLPAIRGFMGPACCTPAGQCGVQQRGFGAPCVDTATVAAQVSMMGVDVSQVPPPTACKPGDGGT